MAEKRCCAACFGDLYLDEFILPDLDPVLTECSYCSEPDQQTVLPERLRDHFDFITSAYEPDISGSNFAVLLKKHWAMFPNIDEANATMLLADIFDDGDVVRRNFKLTYDTTVVDSLRIWDEFRQELMHENRYFPRASIDVSALATFLPRLAKVFTNTGNEYYRARIEDGGGTYLLGNMGAPPKERAGHGRANPAGIPYLYIGSDTVTAVTEVRPHTGDNISIARFVLSRNLTLVDLRCPRESISPFALDEESELQLFHDRIELLEKFGDELTHPVLPRAAAYNYTPSQYLCEFIKSQGFDGVVYRSSIGSGVNYAIFDPSAAIAESVESVRIKNVSVDFNGS